MKTMKNIIIGLLVASLIAFVAAIVAPTVFGFFTGIVVWIVSFSGFMVIGLVFVLIGFVINLFKR